MKTFDTKWLATTLFIIGGTMVAVRAPYMACAFPMFVIAHLILLHNFITTHKNKPLIIQNAYFFLVNIYASYIWLFKG